MSASNILRIGTVGDFHLNIITSFDLPYSTSCRLMLEAVGGSSRICVYLTGEEAAQLARKITEVVHPSDFAAVDARENEDTP